ncbi:MAG: hypothetical protein NVS1B6_12010 [Steroidobacteraceae bacterium]
MTVLGCARVLACVAGCAQSAACEVSCREAGSTAAKSAYDAFTGCVAFSCFSVDGGTGACTSATDIRAACQTCLQSVTALAPAVGSACHSEYFACAADGARL